MCGINGILSLDGERPDYGGAVDLMNAALAHRGPDDAGIYSDAGIALGHRRLSIIDLSDAGHQPMQSADGRYLLVFNGEIYNFRELRTQLDYPFRSHTDTEVLLAAWQAWGPDCIDHLVGMYGFAVWDRHARILHLVRDRLGIKPVYYYSDGTRLLFSSEVRALLASGLVPRRLDRDSLVDYLRYQTVHQPDTIVRGIRMLPPASHLVLDGGQVDVRRYWSPAPAAGNGPDRQEARRVVYDTLLRAVERRLVADVPFGAFLSGGIDSSAIVALMSRLSDRVSTFSITFAEEEFSEARHARRVAEKFGTDHHEIQLSPQHFLELLPEALDRMDHPSGDGPNSYVVSGATKNAGITMALSGLGGDELFAGYSIFRQGVTLEKLCWINALPGPLRALGGRLLRRLRPGIASDKIAGILEQPRIGALPAYPFYRQVLSDTQCRELLDDPGLPPNRVSALLQELGGETGLERLPVLGRISLAEISTYMQHVLLRDTDQMSMAHALEVRVPFLDHELVELVIGLPDGVKYPHTPKQLLVESLGDLLPPQIVNRPKMGFTLPFAQWMRGELHAFCDSRIRRLAERDCFSKETVLRYWNDFGNNSPSISWSRIWTLLVLEHWLEKNDVA
jgi:asparagine synthase (glutamine-hydrolysing)